MSIFPKFRANAWKRTYNSQKALGEASQPEAPTQTPPGQRLMAIVAWAGVGRSDTGTDNGAYLTQEPGCEEAKKDGVVGPTVVPGHPDVAGVPELPLPAFQGPG